MGSVKSCSARYLRAQGSRDFASRPPVSTARTLVSTLQLYELPTSIRAVARGRVLRFGYSWLTCAQNRFHKRIARGHGGGVQVLLLAVGHRENQSSGFFGRWKSVFRVLEIGFQSAGNRFSDSWKSVFRWLEIGFQRAGNRVSESWMRSRGDTAAECRSCFSRSDTAS